MTFSVICGFQKISFILDLEPAVYTHILVFPELPMVIKDSDMAITNSVLEFVTVNV